MPNDTPVPVQETTSREALSDTRATVAGYREVTLVGELSSARTALAAAGIEADLPGAVDEVTGAARELFG
jgi:two-component system sensor histidine kinase DesK